MVSFLSATSIVARAVYFCKPASGFFLSKGSVSIGSNAQRLTAYSTVEAERAQSLSMHDSRARHVGEYNRDSGVHEE